MTSPRPRSHRGLPCLAPLGLIALVLVAAPAVAGDAPAPPSYHETLRTKVGPGLERFKLEGGEGTRNVVNVARLSKDAPYDLRAVPANGLVGHGLERTSSMCARAKCLVAVNGDFWDPATPGVPAGAIISEGRVLRTPSANHDQLAWSRDDGLSAGRMRLGGTLVTSDLDVLRVTSLNTPVEPDGVTLYTPAWGKRTSQDAFEVTLEVVRPAGPVRLGRTILVRVSQHREKGDGAIPSDGLVLAGRGKGSDALRKVWQRLAGGRIDAQALLRMESTPPAVESVGGSPVLLRGGRIVLADERSSLVRGRHPRTLVGRTASGDVLLVTVDGRQPGYSDGMTLHEAATLMRSLGAVDALNLDGGGSSTFVVKGKVVNRPSDRAVVSRGRRRVVHVPSPGQRVLGLVERPVATSLEVVERQSGPDAATARGLLSSLDLGDRGGTRVPYPYVDDPASDPTGRLPAIVVPARSGWSVGQWFAALGSLVGAGVLAIVLDRRMRRRLEAARS